MFSFSCFSAVGVPVWFVFVFVVSKVMALRGTDLLPTVDAQPVWLEFRDSCVALAVRWWRRGDCGRGASPLAIVVPFPSQFFLSKLRATLDTYQTVSPSLVTATTFACICYLGSV